jgi:predicted amidohydrolase YtcJ
VSGTLFRGGTVWTGAKDTHALLISDGVVQALGDHARTDLRTTPALDIPAVRVRRTYLQGEPVYSARN